MPVPLAGPRLRFPGRPLAPSARPGDVRAVGVAAGAGGHAAVVTEDGELWQWGSNYYGELGHHGAGRVLQIHCVASLPPGDLFII